MTRDYAERTVTPEAVLLQADVAGIGSRSIAIMVDTLIQIVLVVPVLFVILGDGLAGTGETVILVVLLFVVLWLYFPAFELFRRGQTPGKRSQGIRVVRTSGQPAGLAPVLVRNLVRIVDVFMFPFLALVSMVVTRRGQRLGDLAAGTMVVRDRKLPAPQVQLPTAPGGAGTLDTTRMTARDYTVLRTFLARRAGLDVQAREQLAARLAARIREQLGERPDAASLSNEQLIEAVAQSYRSRFSDRAG
jgi:uncharacterized RDD family membrane protein YckC